MVARFKAVYFDAKSVFVVITFKSAAADKVDMAASAINILDIAF